MARRTAAPATIPIPRLEEPSADVCLELQDHSTYVRSAGLFFQVTDRRDHAHAARLATQFVTNNRTLAGLLDVDIRQDFDGKDVKLILQSGSAVGAVPLVSPLSARSDFGLVVQPRFPWSGLGPMLSEMGWRVVPRPLRLPLLRRSERGVPPWVLSSMVLARLETLLHSLTRRFELVSETVRSPKGTVDWDSYVRRSIAMGDPLRIPTAFPDLRDDRLLKGAIRYAVERQLQSLYTQTGHGAFVHRLIERAQSLARQVSTVPPAPPTPQVLTGWARRPLRSAALLEGIQAIEWTVDERGLAGLSDLEGIPWRMPMEEFFEAWVETIFHAVAKQTGARMRVRNYLTHPNVIG